MQTTNLKNLGLTFQDAKAATRLLKLPKALILIFFPRCFVDHQRVETERLESSVDRYKQKIHHMEFKTGELEARLNRKEQMIAKLENDLREVSYFSAVVSFLSFPSFFLFCFVLFCFVLFCLFVCLFVSNGAMQNTGERSPKGLYFFAQPGIECSVKLCTNEDRDATSSGN